MPSLLENPEPVAVKLLNTVADGYVALHTWPDGHAKHLIRWPLWEWIRYRLEQDGLDAEEIYTRMPTWQHGYRFIRAQRGTLYPDARESVALTVAGMHYAQHPAMELLIKAFLTGLKLAAQQQKSTPPQPAEVFTIRLSLTEFATTVNNVSGTFVEPEELATILQGEPATWSGVNQDGGGWYWDINRVRLRPYRELFKCEEYLIQLEKLIGVSENPLGAEPLLAMALPDALDHLDLAWRLVTNGPLLRVQRVAVAAKFSHPAISADEFESRCSALSDILNGFNLPSNGGTLNNMKAKLTDLLGAHAGRAHDAVDTLRDVIAIRAGQQHSAVLRAERARSRFGLNALGGDWAAQWEQIRGITIQALNIIREEISVLIT